MEESSSPEPSKLEQKVNSLNLRIKLLEQRDAYSESLEGLEKQVKQLKASTKSALGWLVFTTLISMLGIAALLVDKFWPLEQFLP